MNCLNERWWFWVILNDFEIVWELCHWDTIPQLFWASLSSLNTLWNWTPQQVKQYQSELTQISDTWCSGGDFSKTTWHFRLATQIWIPGAFIMTRLHQLFCLSHPILLVPVFKIFQFAAISKSCWQLWKSWNRQLLQAKCLAFLPVKK